MGKICLCIGAIYELCMRTETAGIAPEDCRQTCTFQAELRPIENAVFHALVIQGLVLQVTELIEPGGTGVTSKPTHRLAKGPTIIQGQGNLAVSRTELLTDI